ncbi:MAG: CdaR family protein [Anaerovoracaceae bacterium]
MLQNNTFLKILSLLIAIFLWFYVMGQVDPVVTKTIKGISVEMRSEDILGERSLAIVGDDQKTVDVTVEGKRAQVNRIASGGIKATVDVGSCRIGENNLDIAVTVPEGISLIKVTEPTTSVKIEEKISAYKPVKVKFIGDAAENREVGNISFYPEKTQITGAKSTVNQVSYVEAKLDLKKINANEKTFEIDPVVRNKSGKKEYNIELYADKIHVTAALLYTKEVPLEVPLKGKVPDNYDIEETQIPEYMYIRGTKESIDKITKVTSRPVDITKLKKTVTLPITVDLPANIEVAQDSKHLQATINIVEAGQKIFTLSTKDSEIKGLEAGLTGKINTQSVILTFNGQHETLTKIAESDFTSSVDLTGLKPGQYDVALKVDTKEKVEKVKTSPKTVRVTITEEENR